MQHELKTFENSPLLYPGGKARRSPELLRLIDQDKKHYLEPLCGGMSMMFCARKSRIFKTYSVNDINCDVTNFWTILRDRSDELIDRLWDCYRHHGSAGDDEIVGKCQEYMRSGDEMARATAFYLINKWSMRGFFSGSGRGHSSCTMQRSNNGITPTMIERLPIFSDLLQDVEITNLDYSKLEVPRDTFIFCDPPYESIGEKFYNHLFNLMEFRDWIRQFKQQSFMITLNDSRTANNLFKYYDRIVVPVKYSPLIRSKSPSFYQRKTTEIVVLNYHRITRDAFIRRFGWSVRNTRIPE
jgi:DNA adenine methylase